MNLSQWQVWHTYATYLTGPANVDGEQAARRLIQSGVAELVFAQSGKVWFRRGRSVATTTLRIEKKPFEAGATFTLPGGMSDYARECAYQAAFMETQERHLVSDPLGLMPGYFRVFIAPCHLIAKDYGYAVYPQVKLFDNGVMLTQLRVLSGDKSLDLQEFIGRHVNLFMVVCEDLRVTPSVFLPYLRSILLSGAGGIQSRLSSTRLLSAIQAWATRAATVAEEELGSWPMLSLSGFPRVEVEESAVPLTTRHLARMIGTAIAETIGSARPLPLRAVLGESRRKPVLGSYWSGRPSVYLIRFDGQPANTREVTDALRRDLAQIMMRSIYPTMGDAAEALGQSTRAYDDFLVFQGKGLSLWVSTLADLAPGRGFPEDPNANYLVLARQVQVEVIDYLHMATRRLRDRALSLARAREIVEAERELVVLEQGMTEVSLMGEVQDLIQQGCTSLAVDTVRLRTRDALNLKSAEIQEHGNVLAARFGTLLTIVFGLMGAPAVQEGLTDPLLRILGWSLAANEDVQAIAGFGIACGVVVGFIVLAYALVRRLSRSL